MQEVKMLYYWFLDFINPIAQPSPPPLSTPQLSHPQVIPAIPQVLVPIRTSCTHEEFLRMLPDVGSDFIKVQCFMSYHQPLQNSILTAVCRGKPEVEFSDFLYFLDTFSATLREKLDCKSSCASI